VVLRELARRSAFKRARDMIRQDEERLGTKKGKSTPQNVIGFHQKLANAESVEIRARYATSKIDDCEIVKYEVAERDAERSEQFARIAEVDIELKRQDSAAEHARTRGGRIDEVSIQGPMKPREPRRDVGGPFDSSVPKSCRELQWCSGRKSIDALNLAAVDCRKWRAECHMHVRVAILEIQP
jgi:hypothetical protein